MHAQTLFHRWLSEVLPKMHRRRLSALVAVVSGAIRGSRLTVTHVGRSIVSEAKEKHNIKRADRLMSNAHLISEHVEVYASVALKILGRSNRPIILIDWAHIDEGKKFYLLRAATPVEGRALTLYEEVHTIETKEKPKTHHIFLRNLARIIPSQAKPIVVTDAGFRGTWFQEIQAKGWDFIGRVRNREMMRFACGEWLHIKSLYPQASSTPKSFKDVELCRNNPLLCSFTLFKGKAKGRKCKTRTGQYARSRRSTKNAARSREPWLLATSLHYESAAKIVKLYASRMQIEEAFRDLKSPRIGFALEYAGTYLHSRMKNLVLIGTLALLFSWLLGTSAVLSNRNREYQANTASGAVLSAPFLGVRIFQKIKVLSTFCLTAAVTTMQKNVAKYGL